jgi:TctA family transporter
MVRYTFGSETLVEGLSLAIVAMGLFGIGEISFMAESVGARSSRDTIKNPGAIRELLPNWRELKTCIMPISRGSILEGSDGRSPFLSF